MALFERIFRSGGVFDGWLGEGCHFLWYCVTKLTECPDIFTVTLHSFEKCIKFAMSRLLLGAKQQGRR